MNRVERKFRKRPRQTPQDKTALSSRLRAISDDIRRGDYEAGLSKANQTLTTSGMSEHDRARVMALVADSEFKRGRFSEAAQIHLQAASICMDHSTLWLRAHIGIVRNLLKVPDVQQATIMALQTVALAKAKMTNFDEEVRLAGQGLESRRLVAVPPVPPRVSVVATRLGYIFLQEGEPEAARELFQKALESSKHGANRARQGLAQIALAMGEPKKALGIARDAILRGKYRAKTLPAWKTLIAARRQLCGWRISDRMIEGLDAVPAGLRARTVLAIVHELRKNNMRQWREVAERWSTQEGVQFPAIETEIRKMIFSSAKAEPGNAADKREKAGYLLAMSGLSAKEWLTGAKELVRASLLAGLAVDIGNLLAEAGSKYGPSYIPRARHSLALSCIMANRHDLARSLLQANIQQMPANHSLWSKSAWALGRLERFLQNHEAAADSYLQVATNETAPLRFRLNARLLWATELVKSGQIGALMLAKDQISAMLGSVNDPEILMDFARQLIVLSPELNAWAQELMDRATQLAMAQFGKAQQPGAALDILYKISRRHVYECNRPDVAVQIWEGLDAQKRSWLWSTQTRYWEYGALLIYSYGLLKNTDQVEQLADEWVYDPATPAEGRPYVGIAYGQWLIANQRIGEALELFEALVKESPSHGQCAIAWYWKALLARIQGDQEGCRHFLVCMRSAQGVAAGFLSEWKLDAKALLLLEDMQIDQVIAQHPVYTPDFLEKCRTEIGNELETLTNYLQTQLA